MVIFLTGVSRLLEFDCYYYFLLFQCGEDSSGLAGSSKVTWTKKGNRLKMERKKLIQTIGIQFYALVVLESEKLKYHFRKLESKITVMLICFCSSSNFSIHEKTVCSNLSISRNGMESFRSQLKGFLDLVFHFFFCYVTKYDYISLLILNTFD
jgi:hypothetical protein